MPKISFEIEDLIQLMECSSEDGQVLVPGDGVNPEKRMDMDTFLHRVAMLGSDVCGLEDGVLEVEFFPNRPDLYSVEGVARAMRAFMNIRSGLANYSLKSSGIVMRVDPSIIPVRPYIGAALVRGLKMTEPMIQSIMGIQEKLHLTMGRKRVKVAIGVHDFEYIRPPFIYKGVDPHEISFVPLDSDTEMDLSEILWRHDKGKEYAFTLEGLSRYPIILDEKWDVLSFPPIINGELTAVTDETVDIFLDITGNDRSAVFHALNIMTTMLAERGGEIYTVSVEYPDHKEILPNFAPVPMELETDFVNRYLGTKFGVDEMVKCLESMGHGCELSNCEGGDGSLMVHVPAYRTDVLHPIDLVEDIAIGYGYDNFPFDLPRCMSFGKPRDLEAICEEMRLFFVGAGFLEVITLSLSNDDVEFRNMGEEVGERVMVMNPISQDHTNIRVWLLPSLLQILKKNQHRDLPQMIFEIGDVVEKRANVRKLGGVIIHNKANFSQAKGLMKSFMNNLGLDNYELVESKRASFIEGRACEVMVKDRELGFFGEFHPRTITRFSLSNPIIGFEIDVGVVKDILLCNKNLSK